MRNSISLFTFLFLLLCAPYGYSEKKEPERKENVPVLIAASATSYSDGSSSIVSLMDGSNSGYWSPKSNDAGGDEGIYLQFKDPVFINYIEIVAEGEDASSTIGIIPYLDGKAITQPSKSGKKGTTHAQGDSGAPSESGDEPRANTPQWLLAYSDNADGNTIFTVQSEDGPLESTVKSVFLKLSERQSESESPGKPSPIRIKSIRFFTQPEYTSSNEPLALQLPLGIKTDASATSTLDPQFAYDVSHLFDSQFDMAWSTDGKTTSGLNESITLRFDSPQTIKGLMFWNGYQRSDTHYKANGRVKKLAVANQILEVQDKQGMQILSLPKEVTADSITLIIKDIYEGSAYSDVLVSELRLLAPSGQIILPQVQAPAVSVPPALADSMDKRLTVFIHDIVAAPDAYQEEDTYGFDRCRSSSIRLRSNGSFVIYKTGKQPALPSGDGPAPGVPNDILEGNWEAVDGNTIRLFGKRYAVVFRERASGYLPGKNDTEEPLRTPKIFQSLMKISRYNTLSAGEQKNIVQYLLKSIPITKHTGSSGSGTPLKTTIFMSNKNASSNGISLVTGNTAQDALSRLSVKLQERDPVFVQSDVYTELLLPGNMAGTCYQGP